MTDAAVDFGFASFADGRFELIVRDRKTWEETTLMGTLEPGQFEVADRILPTCVYVDGIPQSFDLCVSRAADVLWHELCGNIRQTEGNRKHYELAVRQMLAAIGIRRQPDSVTRPHQTSTGE